MRNQGRGIKENWLEHVRIGFNYRMDELAAALGTEQMKKIDLFLKKRNNVAGRYFDLMQNVEGINLPTISPKTTKMSWFVYVIRLDDKTNRDGVIKYLNENGIGCRNYFSAIHKQPFIEGLNAIPRRELPVTEKVSAKTIALPFFNTLSFEQQEYVVEHLKKAIEINS